MSQRARMFFTVIVWLAAIAVAACFDRRVAVFMREHDIEAWMRAHRLLEEIFKAPGQYYFTLIVAVVVGSVHSLRWRGGLFVVLATIVSGVNEVIKWTIGRTRPFKLDVRDAAGRPLAMPFTFSPFPGGIRQMFTAPNLSLPSGHATLAFATAAAVAMLWPRSTWRWIGFLIAVLVATERVLENAHWLSDTVAAAALGIGGVHLIRWMLVKHTRAPNSVPR